MLWMSGKENQLLRRFNAILDAYGKEGSRDFKEIIFTRSSLILLSKT